jgi:hypothetical protein
MFCDGIRDMFCLLDEKILNPYRQQHMCVVKQFLIHLLIFFFCIAWLGSGPGPHSCRIFAIILRQTPLGRTSLN